MYSPIERPVPPRGVPAIRLYLDHPDQVFTRVRTMEIQSQLIEGIGDMAYAFFDYSFEADRTESTGPFRVNGRVLVRDALQRVVDDRNFNEQDWGDLHERRHYERTGRGAAGHRFAEASVMKLGNDAPDGHGSAVR